MSAIRLRPRRPDGFPRSPRRAALVWLSGARRPATREKRVAEIVDRASFGLRTP